MATYKVLQDIEAEDKLLGPLTLKQFIFAIITIALCFIAFLFTKVNVLLALPWLLPISFFGFMATPISKDQPNDVWLAARIRFLIKPRKRVWDQAGMQELVTINAPKKIEISRTDGLSRGEVTSRLGALSSLMDTRGWAVKSLDTIPGTTNYGQSTSNSTERLIELSNDIKEAEYKDMQASDDILDPLNNLNAQRIDAAIKKQQSEKINSLKEMLSSGKALSQPSPREDTDVDTEKIDYSFLAQEATNAEPGYATFGSKVVSPGASKELDASINTAPEISSTEENAFLEKVHHNKEIAEEVRKSSHEHIVSPSHQYRSKGTKKPELTTAKKAPDDIIKELGQANDLSVASIAKLAEHAEQESSFSDNDVISLH